VRVIVVVRGGAVQEVVTDEACNMTLLDYDLFEGGAEEDELRNRESYSAVGKGEVDEALKEWDQAVDEHLKKGKKA
jgi:hypothetical protein